MSDGEWRTIDARGLYREAKAAGVVFQTHLRAEMQRRLGAGFGDVDANGQADIVGIDETLLVEFSTRRVDIESALDDWVTGFVEREGRDPSPVEVGKAHHAITLATRPAKPDTIGHPIATLRAGWRSRADRLVDVDQMLDRVLAHPTSPAVIVRPSVDEVLAGSRDHACRVGRAATDQQIAARTTGPDPDTIADTIDQVRADIFVRSAQRQCLTGDTLRWWLTCRYENYGTTVARSLTASLAANT